MNKEEIFKRTVYGELLGGGEKNRHALATNPRLMAELTMPVDPKHLDRAIAKACEVCPYIAYGMEKREDGLYYVENPTPLRAMRLEDEPPTFDCEKDGHHLIHIMYKENKLVVGMSHCLTDGSGLAWFLDALIRSYAGVQGYMYDGVGKEDYSLDLMAEELPVSAGYVYEDVIRHPSFKLPEAGLRKYFLVNIAAALVLGSAKGKMHEIVADKAAFKAYCQKNNCSVTVAVSMLAAEAIMRVHPENKKSITVRMPVDTRRILNAPHTFHNASMPQANLEIMPEELAGDRKALGGKLMQTLHGQLTYDRMAALTNHFRGTALKEKKKDDKKNKINILKTLDTTIFVSNVGTAEGMDKLVRRIAPQAEGAAPFMIYITSNSSKLFISLMNSFENDCYAKALKAVLADNGIAVQ